MADLDKLDELGILGDIRERLGASDGEDDRYDDHIKKLSPEQIVMGWTGWHLGDSYWGRKAVDLYKELAIGKGLQVKPITPSEDMIDAGTNLVDNKITPQEAEGIYMAMNAAYKEDDS